MKVLGIESAAMTASVAILDDDNLIAEYTIDYKKTHSQTLLPMIAEISDMIKLDKDTIDIIAVSGGPGSFTGLRIGSATAKGLGLALNKKLVHVPTLDAMAYQIFATESIICSIMDARKGYVFAGIYKNSKKFEVIKPAFHASIEEVCEELNKIGESVIFTGDGMDAYWDKIVENCNTEIYKAPAFAKRGRAGAVAALGLLYAKESKTETAREHLPYYLRISQAERQMKEAVKNS